MSKERDRVRKRVEKTINDFEPRVAAGLVEKAVRAAVKLARGWGDRGVGQNKTIKAAMKVFREVQDDLEPMQRNAPL